MFDSLLYLTNACIVAISFAFMCVHFHLLRFKRPTLVGVYYICHLLFQLGPSVFFLQSFDTDAARSFHLACVLQTVLIPVGASLANFCWGSRTRELMVYFSDATLASASSLGRSKVFYTLLAVVCTAIFLLFVKSAGSMPVAKLFSQSASTEEVNEMRLAARGREDAGGVKGYLFGIAVVFLMPLLFTSGIAMWRFTKSYLWKVFYAAMMLLAIVYGAYTSAKTPVVMLFVMGYLLLITRAGRSSHPEDCFKRKGLWIKIALCGSAAVGYALLIFLAKASGGGAFQGSGIAQVLTEGIFSRVFYAPAHSSYLSFEVFPYGHGYTHFMDILKLSAIFGENYVPLSKIIAYSKGQPWGSNAPPATIGTFYAQYGWFALGFGLLGVSAIVQSLNILIVRVANKTPIHEALYVLLLYASFRLSMTNFHTILLTESYVPVFVVLLALSVLAGKRQTSQSIRSESLSNSGLNGVNTA